MEHLTDCCGSGVNIYVRCVYPAVINCLFSVNWCGYEVSSNQRAARVSLYAEQTFSRLFLTLTFVSTGFVWAIGFTCATTKSFANTITKNGSSLPMPHHRLVLASQSAVDRDTNPIDKRQQMIPIKQPELPGPVRLLSKLVPKLHHHLPPR